MKDFDAAKAEAVAIVRASIIRGYGIGPTPEVIAAYDLIKDEPEYEEVRALMEQECRDPIELLEIAASCAFAEGYELEATLQVCRDVYRKASQ